MALRANADKSTSILVLVFSGVKIDVTTADPFALLDAIDNGKVSRLKVQPKKPLNAKEFAVDAMAFREEDDEDDA